MVTTSIPVLGIYTEGSKNSTLAHTEAARDISKQYLQEFPTHKSRIGVRGSFKTNVLTPDEIRSQVDMLTDDTIQHQMMNEYRGKLRNNLKWNWQAFQWLAAPMEMTEWYIRATTALAAYRAFKNGQITRPETLAQYNLTPGQPVDMNIPENYANAVEFAKDLVAMSHGDYTQYNKPSLIRHGWAGAMLRSMYTFRFFNHHLAEMWNWMLQHEGSSRGKYAFAKSMFGNALLGGIKATPIAAFIMWALKEWEKDEPENIVRENTSASLGPMWDAVFEGLPATFGVYLGGSIETGIPQSWAEAIGIPAAVWRDIKNGYEAWASGNKARAMEYIVPLVVMRDIMATYREYNYGKRTPGGKPIALPGEAQPEKLRWWQIPIRALGFRTLSEEKRYRLQSSMEWINEVRTNAQSKFADRYVNALTKQDYEEVVNVLNELGAYNMYWVSKGRTDMLIQPDSIRSSINSRMRLKKPSRGAIGKALRLKEAYQ
jgi:hypothetical protein